MDVGQFCINKLFGRSKEAENLFTPEKFHKSRKIEDMWVAPFLASNKKAGNFNVEDYFPRRVFTRFVLSFKSLNQVISKDAIKKKFEAACLNSTIKGGDYMNFEAVFDLIEKIMKYLLVVAHPDDEVFSEEIDFGGTFGVPLFIFEA